MPCIVGYFRVSRREVEDDPGAVETLAHRVRQHALRRGMPVEGIFVDHYGVRRAPFPQLVLALDLARMRNGLLVLPTLGRTRRDPGFLETLYNAAVAFEVLDQPALTRDTILAAGMSSLRSDMRRS